MRNNQNEVTNKLKSLLESDRFAEKKRLPPERILSLELGVSRAVLRGALSVLEREGKIWRHVGRGTFIGSPLDKVPEPEDISKVSAVTNPAEIMEARLIIEPKLAALAAVRITMSEISALELYLERSRNSEKTADFEKWDELLHQTIARATDNSLLISLFMVIHKVRQSDIWGNLKAVSLTGDRRKIYNQQHHDLVEALRARDAGNAGQIMREHLETIRSHLLNVF
jgi:DNA-binding FadR family transcriptional regulator